VREDEIKPHRGGRADVSSVPGQREEAALQRDPKGQQYNSVNSRN
jgi:hypothetical protein